MTQELENIYWDVAKGLLVSPDAWIELDTSMNKYYEE